MGYIHDATNPEGIKRIISEIESTLDLVMINELFWESLILLKYALDLSNDEIITLQMNQSSSEESLSEIVTQNEHNIINHVNEKNVADRKSVV